MWHEELALARRLPATLVLPPRPGDCVVPSIRFVERESDPGIETDPEMAAPERWTPTGTASWRMHSNHGREYVWK